MTSATTVTGTDNISFRVSEWIATHRSAFQEMLIVRTEEHGRALFVDGAIQSSEQDERIYHEALVHPAMILHASPQRVLVLGGGEGASLREVLRHRWVTQVTMVDIDGALVDLCRRYLPEWSDGAFDDPRATTVIADGKAWVGSSRARFDVVIMDLTDQIDFGPSFALYTQAFYRDLAARLDPGGILVVQAGELSGEDWFTHCSMRRTLETVFTHVKSYVQFVPSYSAPWSWVIASQAPLGRDVDARFVDARIRFRVSSPLAFYTGATHQSLFTLPHALEARLASAGTVVTDPESFRQAMRNAVSDAAA
jgi:spermidine synthase